MANRLGKQPLTTQSALARWVKATADYLGVELRFRLSGNSLHLLCESDPCPDQSALVMQLAHLLKLSQLDRVVPADQSRIYAVRLYGRSPIDKHPAWSTVMYLDQIDSYLNLSSQQAGISPEAFPNEFSITTASASHSLLSLASDLTPRQSELPLRQADDGRGASQPDQISAQPSSDQSTQMEVRQAETKGRLAQSPLQLAKQGRPQAIAHYLSDTLNGLGIGVRVAVKPLPHPQRQSTSHVFSAHTVSMPSHETFEASRRLWVTCEAIYSPDPRVIGEPIARKLRELELEDFRDAVVVIQVQGEPQPDWTLRVDLTPTTTILTEWARWGDVEAISRLAQHALAPIGVRLVNATLNDVTLHMCVEAIASRNLSERADGSVDPITSTHRDVVRARLASLFEQLAPQGIHAAALYGQAAGATKPTWLEWLELPATLHSSLGHSALALAQRGDLEAIAFLLHRCLNPNLDQQFATGGIRIQLLPRDELLHVMCDAPTCPDASTVAFKVINLVRSLHLANTAGIRIYGRRAGQRVPNWSHGVDFVNRQRFSPEATPEFAATDAYVGELVTPVDEAIFRRDLTAADLKSGWHRICKAAVHSVRQSLVQTQLFSLRADVSTLAVTKPRPSSHLVTQTALVWGAVGLLLALQVDWLLPQLVRSSRLAESQVSTPDWDRATDSSNGGGDAAAESPLASDKLPSSANDSLPDLSSVSSSTGLEPFTERSSTDVNGDTASLLADSPYPPFNSDQLDLKLALYYQYVAEFGPPDVLIIGSSRALRGIDPTALEHYLGELGYADVEVFNFGVNGATAQVAELVIRQILTPGQLPKMVVWADGARAFNSGRVDVTYDGIATSEGYEQVISGTLSVPDPTENGRSGQSSNSAENGRTRLWSRGVGRVLAQGYDTIDSWLSDRLASVSTGYSQRDRFKAAIHQQASRILTNDGEPTPTPALTDQGGISATGTPTPADGDPSGDDDLTMNQREPTDQLGFMPIELRFDPATYYQNYSYVPGNYDRDYADFRLEGQQAEALQAILQLSEAADVPIVFVNLPLTSEYLDPYRMEYEQAFREYMLNVSINHEGFTFRDWGEIWLDDPNYRNYFSDPSHLNRYGALEMSKRLAQDPLISWPSSSSAQES